MVKSDSAVLATILALTTSAACGQSAEQSPTIIRCETTTVAGRLTPSIFVIDFQRGRVNEDAAYFMTSSIRWGYMLDGSRGVTYTLNRFPWQITVAAPGAPFWLGRCQEIR